MAKQLHNPDAVKALMPPTLQAEQPFFEPPPWPDELPVPGMYPNTSYEEYRGWEALRSSTLKEAYHGTAKRMRAAMDGLLGGDSPARKFGRAVHCRLLEPEAYKTRFLLAGKCEAIIKSGGRKGEVCGKDSGFYDGTSWYCGVHQKQHEGALEPPDYVSEKEAENIERVVVAVKSHHVVNLLRQHGGCELSFIWDRDGLPCKGRGDKVILDVANPKVRDTIIDIKKCRSGKGDQHSVRTSIRDWGWDMQAAFYCDGLESLTGTLPDFCWVFVEDDVPFDVSVVPLSRAMRQVGRSKVSTAMEIYKRGLEHNHWPGYGDNYMEVEPADWECKRHSVVIR